ncbi:MOSC domain-containing protein [Sulfitobacter sp. F26204]|uniref:MOSC domain-containing protein n=1 Tax=Sulfitobacter sp. F26204 TaxID=2996014 RepID=UPI00225E1C4B|nr:MOSC domain-containing protein [Sulfitobacter sp. F26204]MCX7561878.1 MOSC domain-containing protein [Sulfitobacter sp. F26204]
MNDVRIADLFCYPLKSGRCQNLTSAQLNSDGILGDRRWMVVDEQGVQITAREAPCLLALAIVGGDHDKASLVLPDGERFSIPSQKPVREVNLFSEPLVAADAGDQIAERLSALLGRTARLVEKTPETRRRYDEANYGRFGDAAPLLIMNQNSLDALNARLAWPVSMDRFRPNIVLSGADAFAEDTWKRLEIGDAMLAIVEPCARCVLTTIDSQTRRRDLSQDPLRTLSEFRSDDNGDIHFGIYARVLRSGTIAQGEIVGIRESTTPTVYEKKRAQITIPPDRYLLRLISHETAATQARHLWFRFEGQPPAAPIKPGQYITLRVPQEDGLEAVRSFTISAQRDGGAEIRLSIRQQARGGISEFLTQFAEVGDTVWASGIHGDFTRDDSTHEGLFLSAGSGVTPFLAMLAQTAYFGEVVHIHMDRAADRAIGLDELNTAQKRIPGYSLQTRWSGEVGRLDTDCLSSIPRLASRTVWLCGPNGFVEGAKTLLGQLGVAPHNIRTEVFTRPSSGEETGETFEAILDGGPPVRVDAGIPLLKALRAAGLNLPSSCEIGSCGTCRLKLIEGHCQGAAGEDQTGTVLPCTAYARSDLRLKRYL